MVGVTGLITAEGKKYFLYKSKVKAITSSCNGNEIEIQVVPNFMSLQYWELESKEDTV